MGRDAHIYHYMVLVSGLLVSLFFFLYFNHSPTIQLISGVSGCVFYSAWGIIHGLLEQRINRHIVLEYVTLSLFVLALLFVTVSVE